MNHLGRNLKNRRALKSREFRFRLTRCDADPRLELDTKVTKIMRQRFYGLTRSCNRLQT